MDIKKETRERMEVRGYITQTLATILDTVRATKPSEYVPPPGKESTISAEKMQGLWIDWLDKVEPIVAKGLKMADLLGDDAVALLEDLLADRKATSEDKPGPTRV